MERSTVDGDATTRTCATCAHFDRETAQRMMRLEPAFAAIMDDTMPRQLFGVGPDDPAYRADWSDLGACRPTESIHPPTFSCDKWRARLSVVSEPEKAP